MTIISENLKTLRNKINCTQMTLSKVLEIGFRTYVRYEAGERDTPVTVMVKLSKLANLSLDQLLTTKILPEDLDTSGLENTQYIIQNPEVISGCIEDGRLMLKGFLEDNLVTNTKDEQKLLTLFRKVNHTSQDKFLQDLKWAINISPISRSNDSKRISQKLEKKQAAVKLKKLAKNIKRNTVRS